MVPHENDPDHIRNDETLDEILRIYIPDLEKVKIWQAPKAEIL